jgi:hypothetical protein
VGDDIYGERVIAKAEWDFDTMASRQRCKECPPFLASTILTACLLLPVACFKCNPFCAVKKVQQRLSATHLLVTPRNLIYRIDEHHEICSCPCCLYGAEETIVQLGNITDIHTTTPNDCCLNYCCTVTHVEIQTAGVGMGGSAEISQEGIANAAAFKEAVLAARRGDLPPAARAPIGSGHAAMHAPPGQHAPMTNSAIAAQQQAMMPQGAEGGVAAELERLNSIHRQGIINDQEFAQAKARVLTPPPQPAMMYYPPPPVTYAPPGAEYYAPAPQQQPAYGGGGYPSPPPAAAAPYGYQDTGMQRHSDDVDEGVPEMTYPTAPPPMRH